MADLETELQSLREAEAQLAVIRRQLGEVEQSIEQSSDPRALDSYRRSQKLLIKIQQTFSDHRAVLLDSVARKQGDEPVPPSRLAAAAGAQRGPSASVRKWEQW